MSERPFVDAFFDRLKADSLDDPGVTRDPYGAGENRAHEYFAQTAADIGLDVGRDHAANSYATWRGLDRAAPRIVIGSHLDSVPHGGNFDGAAGVVAGLAIMRALKGLGLVPQCDLTTMAIRAEESMWFRVSYIGSRAALGLLPESALAYPRSDTGRELGAHMTDCGADVDAVANGIRSVETASVGAFFEIHIEQAPSLIDVGVPFGVCTAVPGNFRYPSARVVGEYNHVGLPRRFRRDAVMAATDLVSALDSLWQAREDAGAPVAITVGQLGTDPAEHSLTRVPGEVRFCLDVRAYEEGELKDMERAFGDTLGEIETRRGVTFELGPRRGVDVGPMAPELIAALEDSARRLEIPTIRLGSPGSHDAAAFAAAGVPTAMMMVRNANGSHNPAEAMETTDLLLASTVLAHWLAGNACGSAGSGIA